MILMTAATLAVIPACNAKVPVLIEGGNQDLNAEVENLFNGKEHFEEIETKTVHHDSRMGMSDEDREMRPKVGAPNRLCTSANISGRDCFVGRNLKDKSIRFTSDTYYASEYNLIFNQTRLRCCKSTRQQTQERRAALPAPCACVCVCPRAPVRARRRHPSSPRTQSCSLCATSNPDSDKRGHLAEICHPRTTS